MKKLQLALSALAISLMVIGCSQQSNPVESTTGTPMQAVNFDGNPHGGNSPDDPNSPSFISIPDYDAIEGQTEVTLPITTAGGNIKLKTFYMKNGIKVASISAQIKFQAGSLTQNRNITIRLNPTTLGFEFLPHGIQFNVPALLTIDTYGLDLTDYKRGTDLWYIINGDWVESLQGRMVKVNVPQGKLMVNDIELRHFSAYAFGRVK